MNFCSECGSEKLDQIIPEGDSRLRYVCANCNAIHYQNPRMIVGTLSTYEGKVLLCRRNIEPRKGLWNLPAGFLENNESAEEGAVRETFEESEAKVEIEHLLCVYSLHKAEQVYLHFKATMTSPHIAVTSESSEVKLFSKSEIPWDEIAFTSTTYALKKYFENPKSKVTHIGSYKKEFAK